jgi:hypothetical protein
MKSGDRYRTVAAPRSLDGGGASFTLARFELTRRRPRIFLDSEDPIGLAGGVNRYAYVGSDPVNRIDPSGLCDGPTKAQFIHQDNGAPDPLLVFSPEVGRTWNESPQLGVGARRLMSFGEVG